MIRHFLMETTLTDQRLKLPSWAKEQLLGIVIPWIPIIICSSPHHRTRDGTRWLDYPFLF